MKETFRCQNCRKRKTKTTRDQKFCSDEPCQKARKKTWARKKYRSDPEYRINQQESTKAWLEANGGSAQYYREYRKRSSCKALVKASKPAKADLNSTEYPLQPSANSDGSTRKKAPITRRCVIFFDPKEGCAKSDAIEAEIVINADCSEFFANMDSLPIQT